MRRLVRCFAINWELATAHWVVPTRIWRLIDRDKLAQASVELDRQARYWGDQEPEIKRARSMVEFLTPNAPVSGGTPSAQVAGSPHYSAVCPKCNKTTAWLDPRHEAEDVLCIHCGHLLEGANP